MINIHDRHFVPFISGEEIDFALANMAKKMDDDFFEETPVFVGFLEGSFMVMSNLLKHYKGMCEVAFVQQAANGGDISDANLQLSLPNLNLEGRTVVLVYDVVETGNSLEQLKTIFKEKKVKHLKFATFFFKPNLYAKDLKIDYIGIRIPDKFIVGYGIDYKGLGRNLQDVYEMAD